MSIIDTPVVTADPLAVFTLLNEIADEIRDDLFFGSYYDEYDCLVADGVERQLVMATVFATFGVVGWEESITEYEYPGVSYTHYLGGVAPATSPWLFFEALVALTAPPRCLPRWYCDQHVSCDCEPF